MFEKKIDKDQLFSELVAEVKACKKCARMCNSQRVLGHASGSLDAKVMFVGEAPGRLGADSSQIPFHGDQSGHNFEALISQVGLSRYSLFVTNAVLCNPRTEDGNNSTPTKTEIENCAPFLRRQIAIINPTVVVALGAKSLSAMNLLDAHSLTLKENVRTAKRWNETTLIPSYHPGQRAMMHRSYLNQLADYQFIAETVRRAPNKSKKLYGSVSGRSVDIVNLITSLKPCITYFALHKLFYLIEFQAVKILGRRITDAYITRQKDGPYCTELHPTKIKRQIPELRFQGSGPSLTLVRISADFFSENTTNLTLEEIQIVEDVVAKYGDFKDADLKRCAYLTSEMRKLLRREKYSNENFFNFPLLSK